jgi:hypothetical protein
VSCKSLKFNTEGISIRRICKHSPGKETLLNFVLQSNESEREGESLVCGNHRNQGRIRHLLMKTKGWSRPERARRSIDLEQRATKFNWLVLTGHPDSEHVTQMPFRLSFDSRSALDNPITAPITLMLDLGEFITTSSIARYLSKHSGNVMRSRPPRNSEA